MIADVKSGPLELMVDGRAWHIFEPILIATAERLTYRQFLPLVVPVSIHNVAENIHA